GGGLMTLGTVSLVVATIFGLGYLDARSEGTQLQAKEIQFKASVPKNPDESTRKDAWCNAQRDVEPVDIPRAERLCKLNDEAVTKNVVFWSTATAGAVLLLGGAYFFFWGGRSEEKEAAKSKTRLVPTFGTGGGELVIVGAF